MPTGWLESAVMWRRLSGVMSVPGNCRLARRAMRVRALWWRLDTYRLGGCTRQELLDKQRRALEGVREA